MPASPGFRVTYATMSADDDELHAAYDGAVEEARSLLGLDHPFHVAGEDRWGEDRVETRSPVDRDVVIGRFSQATEEDVAEAVGAARTGFGSWSATPWRERVEVLRRAADMISDRRNVLAALVGHEVGKNRLEALGDVEESADLIRYYCHEIEHHDGFDQPMRRLSQNEATRDVMRPYGVWGVISPFNYPMALAAGPVGAALVAGNTVVLKPSNVGALTALQLGGILYEAGVPTDAFHLVTGAGPVAGAMLASEVDGLTFTGSYEVGMGLYRSFARRYPKPILCEMGGKNPVIVSRHADLDEASDGIVRSAFGFGGQKCSAASRAYVQAPVYDELVSRIVEKASKLVVGNPLERDVYLGPVIDERAVGRYEEATEEARRHGAVLFGGRRLVDGPLDNGNYVQPAVVEAPHDSWLWERELFAPLLAVRAVDSVGEGIDLANGTDYGLTAGFFSREPEEVDRFLDRIEAGVVYVNRRIGATTGAWPAVQPFGGWKGSGTAGKLGGGPYYLEQYLREQSHTVVEG